MGEGNYRRALPVIVALVLAAVALGLAGPTAGAGDGADTTAERSTPILYTDHSTVTDHSVSVATNAASTAAIQENDTDEDIQTILDAIPDSVLEELPEGFVDDLLMEFGDDELIDQIAAQLEEFPDVIIEPLAEQLADNIPDEVLQNADELVENPPDEIPSPLCRADDMKGKADPGEREEWGPTNVNSQIGNQNLTITTNELGTVTTFKYPSPSYADQVKHHAFDRRDPYYGADNNSGTFLGLAYTTDDGEEQLDWLRDWGPVSTSDPDYAEHVNMSWESDMSDTLVTEYTNETLGLTVTVVDAIPKDEDVHIRDIQVDATEDSPVTDVEVVSYANFNLVDNKDPLIPTQDWCSESENDARVTYDEDADAIVYETPDYEPGLPAEMIQGAGPQFSVATAMAFDGESSQHQIAGDDFMGNHSEDPYRLLSNGTLDLPGHDNHTGQVSTAMTRDISFEDGSGQARVYFGAASDEEPELDLGENATAKVEEARSLSLDAVIEEKEEWFDQYVGDAPLPAGAPENVTQLSKRALVSLVQVWDPYTENEHGFSGNIIAAVPTQAPYGADWIRDGAYFNYALDRFFGENASGLNNWVNKHNRWYKSLQQNRGGDCPEHCNDNMEHYDLGLGIVPESSTLRDQAFRELPFVSTTHRGSWAMNYYADGVPAGPLGSEIDETAYGAWTFWDHYAVTENETYLQEIYPAIRLVGERLTDECVDEETGLQCPRPEDDNVEYTQSMTGGASVYAGLDAAAKAAGKMYEITGDQQYAEDALAYAERRDELRAAMDKYYWNETRGSYGSGRAAFPAFVRPFDDERMQRQLQNMWEKINKTFSGVKDQGQYEAKNLIGLGVAARVTDDPPVSREKLQTGVEWLASQAARAETTHILGEAWVRETYADNEVDSAVSQPHIWQQILNYKAALLAYGNESVGGMDRIGHEAYTEWRNHDAALGEMTMDEEATAGDTVEASVTVENEAPVDQAYHLTYTIDGPGGQQYNATAMDVGPIEAGGSETVTLSWDAVDAPAGEYDATVTAWKAAATDENGDPDPVAIAEEPTALANPEFRSVSLDSVASTLTLTEDDPDDGTGDGGTDDGTGDGGADDGTGDDGADDGTGDGGTDDGTGDDGADDGTGDDGADDGMDDSMDDSEGDSTDDSEGDSEDGGGPGFGVIVALLAVIGAALLAQYRYRTDE
jgi:PGF-CTERM protein